MDNSSFPRTALTWAAERNGRGEDPVKHGAGQWRQSEWQFGTVLGQRQCWLRLAEYFGEVKFLVPLSIRRSGTDEDSIKEKRYQHFDRNASIKIPPTKLKLTKIDWCFFRFYTRLKVFLFPATMALGFFVVPIMLLSRVHHERGCSVCQSSRLQRQIVVNRILYSVHGIQHSNSIPIISFHNLSLTDVCLGLVCHYHYPLLSPSKHNASTSTL